MDRFISFNPDYEADDFFEDLPKVRCDACNALMRYTGGSFQDEDDRVYYPVECLNEVCPESPYFEEEVAICA